MRIVMFYHSLLSDWNHGNAHFLRGVASELIARGHLLRVYEPRDAWSVENLLRDQGRRPVALFHQAYPQLRSLRYRRDRLDLDAAVGQADLVIVHEWNDHDLVARLGEHRRRSGRYLLLFHDTHHRSVSDPAGMARYDLRHYDGVLAFGETVRQIYLRQGWSRRAWTWHEAADVRVFAPRPARRKRGDVVWIGNWGDDERTQELNDFLIEPIRRLRLAGRVHGVRYPDQARAALAEAGIVYGGWLANFQAPARFAEHRLTVHVPRRPYTRMLPGIPTIRPFEALACGIPMISAPWQDCEQLFDAQRDYLLAHDAAEMSRLIARLLRRPWQARRMAEHGWRTILRRHTCRHRVDQLLDICDQLGVDTAAGAQTAAEAVSS